MKIGSFTVKAMPGQPMTDDEILRQIRYVSECAEACAFVTEQIEIDDHLLSERRSQS